jgi:predicted transcriptional regulator
MARRKKYKYANDPLARMLKVAERWARLHAEEDGHIPANNISDLKRLMRNEMTEGRTHANELTTRRQQVFNFIEKNGPRVTGKKICNALKIDQGTLTHHIIPALKPYGVRNQKGRGGGYYIEATRKPFRAH